MSFNSVDFWLQIHNIPLLCMTEDIGTFLGSMIGEVSAVDTGTTSDCSGNFLRVRVRVSVDEPLRRSLRVDLLGEGKVTTMLLRYERLLDYCFRCGRPGHIMEACHDVENGLDMSSDASRKFGVWLRAVSPPKRPFMANGRIGNRSWNKHKESGERRLTSGNRCGSQNNWRERKPSVHGGASGGRNTEDGEAPREKKQVATLEKRNACMDASVEGNSEQPIIAKDEGNMTTMITSDNDEWPSGQQKV
ncbi:hypothetical protein Ddye_023123 [Dipteronia dyeriana]|uniref:CCHC-type domain-containing protein n=1 Tax=Dipteronia dyeriana TaxID=168575 RepID=A0AAD9TSB6_9ROSI|nr:hypothetical protein Ddye_023123 [Dipteronia dyeriana]